VRSYVICHKNIALILTMCTAREVYHRTNEDGAKIIMVKIIDATTFKWTRFNCWFKTSSDI